MGKVDRLVNVFPLVISPKSLTSSTCDPQSSLCTRQPWSSGKKAWSASVFFLPRRTSGPSPEERAPLLQHFYCRTEAEKHTWMMYYQLIQGWLYDMMIKTIKMFFHPKLKKGVILMKAPSISLPHSDTSQQRRSDTCRVSEERQGSCRALGSSATLCCCSCPPTCCSRHDGYGGTCPSGCSPCWGSKEDWQRSGWEKKWQEVLGDAVQNDAMANMHAGWSMIINLEIFLCRKTGRTQLLSSTISTHRVCKGYSSITNQLFSLH